MLGTWTPVLLAAILCCVTALAWPLLRMIWLARKLPGPRGYPLLGNSLDFLRGPEDTFRLVCQLFERHGPVVRVWFGPKLVVGVAGPAEAQFVLSHPALFDRDPHFNAAENGFIDNGLLTATGDTARRHRKVVAPAFHYSVLSSYVAVFARKADLLCSRLTKMADGRSFNAKLELSLATLDSIYETAIGVSMEYSDEQLARSRDYIDTGMALIYTRLSKPWLQLPWIYNLTSDSRVRAQCRQGGFRDFEHMLRKKAEQAAHKEVTSPSRFQSFLDSALEGVGGVMTHDEVREEMFTLAAAGMDTTAQTMAYVLILLGMHPDIQDEVFQEQAAIFGDSLRAAAHEELPKMAALDRVIKETLRLFPPATFLPRHIPQDIVLPGGHLLPRGCSVWVFNYTMHRCARSFPEPTRFLPARWTTAQPNATARHAYIPFGAGARSCIGQKYAHAQMKTTLSRVLREFRVRSEYKMADLERIEFSVSNISAVGYDVQLAARYPG